MHFCLIAYYYTILEEEKCANFFIHNQYHLCQQKDYQPLSDSFYVPLLWLTVHKKVSLCDKCQKACFI